MSTTATSGLVAMVNRVAHIAELALHKVSWFVGLGLVASTGLAWKLYSADSALWWNLIKCGFVVLPSLVWAFIWFVLSQLRDAPQLVTNLASDDAGVFTNLDELSFREPNGLRGLASTLNEFRKEDGLSVIFDTIGGVALIANPFFLIVAFAAMMLLSLLILIAPFVLLF